MTNFYKIISGCFASAAVATLIYWLYLLINPNKYDSYASIDVEFKAFALFLVVLFTIAALMSYFAYKLNKIRKT